MLRVFYWFAVWYLVVYDYQYVAAQSYVVAWEGGVEVRFKPDNAPLLGGDLVGGTLSLHTAEHSSLVTFAELALSNLHHVAALGEFPTPIATDHFDANHAQHDSHLLITQDMIAGQAGDWFRESGIDVLEMTNPTGRQDRIAPDRFGVPANTYRGHIDNGNGAFFLHPELQINQVDFAQLVGVTGTTSSLRFRALGKIIRDPWLGFDIHWNAWGTPPSVEIDVPEFVAPGTTILLTPTIGDIDDEIQLVEFYDNGHLIPGCRFTSAPFTCEWTPSMFYHPWHELRVLATDQSGNTSLSASQEAVVFTRRPQITSWHPRTNINVGETVVFGLSATDPDGIAQVTFLADGNPIPGCADAADDRCQWTPTEIGQHSIVAQVRDSKGFVSETEPLDFGVVEPFSIEKIGHQRRFAVGVPTTLAAEVTGPVRHVEFLYHDGMFLKQPLPNCQFVEPPYSCQWTPTQASQVASASILARAVDHAGNMREFKWFVDVLDPLTLTSPSMDRALRPGDTIQLRAYPFEDISLTSVGFYANGELIPDCELFTAPYECEWTPTEGDYDLQAVGQGESRIVSESRRVAVIPPGSVGVGQGLPSAEDGFLVLDVDAVDAKNLPSLLVDVPIGVGGPISIVEIIEIEDPSDAFRIPRTGGEPIVYETMPSSTITLGFPIETGLAAGDYSATYDLLFDDGTRIRTTLNAHIPPDSSLLAPEPSASLLIALSTLSLLAMLRGLEIGPSLAAQRS